MEKIIELFAFFLLALLGFVTPILGIILSTFAQGLSKLAEQYNTERIQTEEKLKNQLQKIGDSVAIEVKEIKKTINDLQSVKRTAERKLRLLSPIKASISIFIPLMIAFLLLLPTFIISLPTIFSWFPLLSLFLVVFAFYQLWRILGIIIETMKILESESKKEQGKTTDLLAEIVRNTKEGAAYFIEKVFISFNNIKLDQDINEIALPVNIKTNVPFSLINREFKMAKGVEAGLLFPTDFLIDKSSGYSIYAAGSEQIVRYSIDRIQASTNQLLSSLGLTPLKIGVYDFQVFVKGENIITKYRTLKIKVS